MPAFTHPRSTWQDPNLPITGPAIDWTRIDTVAVHYTAADDLIDGDPGEHAENLPGYLRAIQRDYMTHRVPPYSVGYGCAVDWLGGSWELRGVDIKCAANKGHNEHTIAILVLVDGNDMATEYAAAEIRRLIAWFEQLARRELKITGHGQLTNPDAATACPGSGLRAQLALGEFSPRWVDPNQPITPLPTIPTEDDMTARLWRHPRYLNVFLIGAGPAINVSPRLFDSYFNVEKVPYIEEAHDQLLKGCLAQAGLTTADLVEAG